MKILLFGRNGQIGWELNRSLQPLGKVVVLTHLDADFSNPESLRVLVRSEAPDIIVNAVAYTAVDNAEKEEDLSSIINGVAPGVLAEEALRLKSLFIHYSTDYVFDGNKKTAYLETDSPNPINAYGRTKLLGEKEVQLSGCDFLIFRTSWVYASRGHNFLLTILKLAEEREKLSIVGDQQGSPTSARLIADTTSLCIKQVMKERRNGTFVSNLYHLTASNSTTWAGFAERIINVAREELGYTFNTKCIESIATAEYPTPAKRPFNSCLDLSRLEQYFNLTMPDWEETLDLCLEEKHEHV